MTKKVKEYEYNESNQGINILNKEINITVVKEKYMISGQ